MTAATLPTRAARVARQGVQRERGPLAYPLLVSVVALVALGVVMVYSASSVRSYFASADASAQGVQQAIWAVLGLSTMLILSRLDFRLLRHLAIPGLLLSLALLGAVLIPGIGIGVSGSRRWLVLPLIGAVQPAEMAKLAICVYLAHWLDRRGHEARGFAHGFVPFALLVGPGFLLIALEPDLGTAGVYATAALAIFFVSGANLLYFSALAGSVIAAAVAMVLATPYQLQRVQAFLDPFSDPLRSGYNAVQALLALGTGGLLGLGLGASRQKFLYLPAPSTDFIFAIIGEEWGLVGTLAVLGLFVLIAYHGYRIAIHAPDTFSGLLAAGLTTWLVVQAAINMMVVTALLPVTGIPLPFISYGGSALIVNLAAVGILLSISREATRTGTLLHAVFGVRRRDRGPRAPRAGRRPGPAPRATRA